MDSLAVGVHVDYKNNEHHRVLTRRPCMQSAYRKQNDQLAVCATAAHHPTDPHFANR